MEPQLTDPCAESSRGWWHPSRTSLYVVARRLFIASLTPPSASLTPPPPPPPPPPPLSSRSLMRSLHCPPHTAPRTDTYKYCSPTRRSFLTGRLPIHMTGAQANPCTNWLPLEFTILPQKLLKAGFESHVIGKGHWGYQTMDHLPVNRGFKSHVGCVACERELWRDKRSTHTLDHNSHSLDFLSLFSLPPPPPLSLSLWLPQLPVRRRRLRSRLQRRAEHEARLLLNPRAMRPRYVA